MDDLRPILSICIPTYNRADKLQKCISCVVRAIKTRKDIEVIVSDNASNDETSDVVASFKYLPFFSSYKNEVNVGFNRNITLLIDKYAHGKYCWIIGDDDYLDEDAIDLLYSILCRKKYLFISIAHRCLELKHYEKLRIDENRNIETFEDSYFKCIDINTSSSNILGTFMSSQIFDLDIVRLFDKSVFLENTWENFKVVFPNSYMMTSCFYRNKECLCVTTPLISALTYSKDWDDKLGNLYTKILPEYLDYCLSISNDRNELKNNRKVVLLGCLSFEFRELLKSQGIKNKFRLFSPRYYPIYFSKIRGYIQSIFV